MLASFLLQKNVSVPCLPLTFRQLNGPMSILNFEKKIEQLIRMHIFTKGGELKRGGKSVSIVSEFTRNREVGDPMDFFYGCFNENIITSLCLFIFYISL